MSPNQYYLFVLGMAAVVILIAGVIRKSYILSNQMELANRARRRKLKEQAIQQKQESKSLKHWQKENRPGPATARQLQNVRTPWGWPHHEDLTNQKQTATVSSNPLRRFANRLIDPKKTKEDQEYLEKRNASIRALLEDRYGRASRMTEIPYSKVKAPLLRDPSAPYDQLDSMPSSRADQVVSRLRKQKQPGADLHMPDSATSTLENIKTPWGW